MLGSTVRHMESLTDRESWPPDVIIKKKKKASLLLLVACDVFFGARDVWPEMHVWTTMTKEMHVLEDYTYGGAHGGHG